MKKRFTLLLLAVISAASTSVRADNNAFLQTNLVASNGNYGASIIDPNILNSWGIALRPPGAGGHIWINGARTGIAAEYIGDVNGIPLHQDGLTDVPLDTPGFTDTGHADLTGIVYNAASDLSGQVVEFAVPSNSPANNDNTNPPSPIVGGTSGAAKFVFVTKDGTINAWRSNTATAMPTAPVIIDYSKTSTHPYLANPVYTGVAMSTNLVTSTDPTLGNHLYAADFRNDVIQVFNNKWADVTPAAGSNGPYAFATPTAAGTLHPFNVEDLGGHVFVTYAQFNAGSDEGFEDNPGFGHLAEFDEQGNLIKDFNSGTIEAFSNDENPSATGVLNSPWGMTIAPAGFGKFGGDLLVANFGDGTIAAFDIATGNFIDDLRDADGNIVSVDGIWGLTFGNGTPTDGGSLGDANSLYFTSGPNSEQDGLFGKLTTVPEPTSLVMLSLAALPLLKRRRG